MSYFDLKSWYGHLNVQFWQFWHGPNVFKNCSEIVLCLWFLPSHPFAFLTRLPSHSFAFLTRLPSYSFAFSLICLLTRLLSHSFAFSLVCIVGSLDNTKNAQRNFFVYPIPSKTCKLYMYIRNNKRQKVVYEEFICITIRYHIFHGFLLLLLLLRGLLLLLLRGSLW